LRQDSAKWTLLLEAQRGSALSVKDFCASQGISAGNYYRWQQRLRDHDGARFDRIEIQAKPGGSIAVELPGGVVLRFGELPPVEYLRSLSSMYSCH
jgi:hypothetical protein